MRPTLRIPRDGMSPRVVHDKARLNAIATQQTFPLHDSAVRFDQFANRQTGTAWAGIHGSTQSSLLKTLYQTGAAGSTPATMTGERDSNRAALTAET